MMQPPRDKLVLGYARRTCRLFEKHYASKEPGRRSSRHSAVDAQTVNRNDVDPGCDSLSLVASSLLSQSVAGCDPVVGLGLLVTNSHRRSALIHDEQL